MLPDIEHGMSMPFNILKVKGEALVCLSAARILPGRRLVCRGTWNGKFVYAKLYTGQKAERDWQRDQSGSTAMQMRAVPTAKLLHSQQLENGFVIVYEALEPSSSLLDSYRKSDHIGKAGLRQGCVKLFAQLHTGNLLHTDPHLDNILVYDGQLYLIDAGAIEFKDELLLREDAEANLAVLLAQFTNLDDNEVDTLYQFYLGERQLGYSSGDCEKFRQRLQAARDYRQRKYLEKIFRECSAFVCEKNFDRYVVFDREYDSEDFRLLIGNPDRFIQSDSAALLKLGNTSTVAEVDCDDKRFVVKRYNVKHLWHGARRMLRMTRAATSWHNAHLLSMLDIPTAKPVAFIENRFGPLRGSSYFIMQTVNGTRADQYFVDNSIPLQVRQGHAEVLLYLFERIAVAGLVHGDYKATNFMITDHGPVLLDLDAMQAVSNRDAFRAGLEKDLRRFMLNWQGQPEAESLFREGLEGLAGQYGIELEKTV